MSISEFQKNWPKQLAANHYKHSHVKALNKYETEVKECKESDLGRSTSATGEAEYEVGWENEGKSWWKRF